MKSQNEYYADIVRDRYEENAKSAKAATEYMKNSTAIYKGEAIPFLYMPKLFSKQAWDHLKGAANTICIILDKVMHRYYKDSSYRKLFPFSPELEELILLEAGYPRMLPISRLDIFFNEEDFSFKFCEFNADGASAMNEDRELNIALSTSDAMMEFKKKYEVTSFNLFDSWAKEFIEIYGTYENKVENPKVVITDFMDRGSPNEFIEFKKAFQRAGLDADIFEIRDFAIKNGELIAPDGKKIDAVYRRAVTRDIMERKNEVGAFLQAAHDNTVCIIGHFRTQIIHTKSIFAILRMPETFEFLTPEEREYVLLHVPETIKLKSGGFDFEDVIKNKDLWLIKPEDYYASKGVYAGIDMDTGAWRGVVAQAMDTPYLLQRYCTPFQSVNLDFNDNPRPDFELYNNITGMFVYNGKLTGLYSRAGKMGTISALASGRTLASMVVYGG